VTTVHLFLARLFHFGYASLNYKYEVTTRSKKRFFIELQPSREGRVGGNRIRASGRRPALYHVVPSAFVTWARTHPACEIVKM
jgi:hypothetical protein